MRLINQSAEIWQQPEGEVGIYKAVERAARLCYRSEDKVTEESYKRFIDMLDERKHRSPYEHGTVYLTTDDSSIARRYGNNPYSKVVMVERNLCDMTYYITSNYRVLKEREWEEDLQYLCDPTPAHKKRVSVHITTSIGISRELNRHRCHSICEESTRYCNYSKDKFGNDLTFILPSHIKLDTEVTSDNELCLFGKQYDLTDANLRFLGTLVEAKYAYLRLLENGWKPQQARDVLPLATKTELIHTAYEDDWEEFFKLRCSPAAHPMMQELANQIKELIHGTKD